MLHARAKQLGKRLLTAAILTTDVCVAVGLTILIPSNYEFYGQSLRSLDESG